MEGKMMKPDDKIISPGFRIGDKVRIVLRGLSECGVTGTVNFFDTATGWYSVDRDSGPPWRGYYTVWELEHITAQGDGQGGKPNGGKDDEA
jgi:hypothetical protein